MTKSKESNEQGWNLHTSYTNLPEAFYSTINLNPVSSPELPVFNDSLAKTLGLNPDELKSDEGVEVLAGNRMPEGSIPLAEAYAGHQFGNFTMLGDGRALLIGEQVTPDKKRFDIQLKGSGPTPYSRRGDGRASLGPMLREYIISEGMHGLGISTSRSLSVVTTGEKIRRETFETGAILTRVASSHLRVGTFQYALALDDVKKLKALADYTMYRHFPEIKDDEDPYLSLLRKVIERQAELISQWMLVGFIHGVMNTDNMAISGETIDYGPCAFMDTYHPGTVFSSIDVQGRYAYANQPPIAGWNLARFAETLLPLLHDDQDEAVKIAQEEMGVFTDLYRENWLTGMRAKLGLFNEEEDDQSLIQDLFKLMEEYKADFTNTFLALTFDKETDGVQVLLGTDEFKKWKERWKERLGRQEQSMEESHELMRNHNPALIPRNHRVEEALEAAVEKEDYSMMERLLNALSNPYEHTTEQAEYAKLPPDSDRPYRTFCGT
ncbi:protein adenylyltransferase SelO [Pseudalkalibacillus caeni]|uniref:Protein nucleotidyltransferase YdiU n=1 Tax=Exobacillus caeni TaxID=2574798 RepID=A0A5R9FB05_9BACL|nr:YdiU family protein [Pseudalkalibacillus caeni]TLS36805.1 YdiU family protein [Pseudalkalibacillus caeni]